MFALAKRGAGAKPKSRICPSTLTVFLGKRRCSAAEAEPTVELAQRCHPEDTSADVWCPKDLVPRPFTSAARCLYGVF